MVTFILDGVLYENPEGWEETEAKITFDHDTQITSVDYTQEYTFYGAAYSYLYGKYITGNYCDLVSVQIIRDGTTIVNGVIFVTSCKFNESKCSVIAKVDDDSFSARIQNNLSVKVEANGELSKNGVAITPVPINDILLFYKDGVYFNNGRKGYFVHDILKWHVAWMTDNAVNFVSDFYQIGYGAVDMCSSGVNLRDISGVSDVKPKIDFRTLFSTCRKLRNVGMGFQRIGGVPTVRIEHIDFFRTNTNFVALYNINDIELSFVQELLYSNIQVGSEITRVRDCDEAQTNCGAFVEVTYYGFEEDSFGLTGVCNLDFGLDLTIDTDVVIDPNTIEDISSYENDGNDDSFICIQVDLPAMTAPPQYIGYYKANQSDPLNIQQAWFNNDYRNESILLRYADYINGNIGSFQLINNLNLFLVSGSSPLGRMSPSIDYNSALANTPLWTTYPPANSAIFFNDTAYIQNSGSTVQRIIDGFQCYDSGGQYDDTTGVYTALYEGAYRFSMQFSIQVTSSSPAGQVTYRMNLLRYDSGGTLIQTYTSQLVAANTFTLTGAFYPTIIYDTGFVEGELGDYYTVTFEANTSNPFYTELQILEGWFECTETRSVIQTIQNNTGNKRLGVRRSFDYPITCEVSNEILNDVTTQVLLTGINTSKQGFIESAQINLITGKSTFDIITNS